MTAEELKRYKAEIRKLKQESIDQPLENVKKSTSDLPKLENTFPKPKDGSLLSMLKSLENSILKTKNDKLLKVDENKKATSVSETPKLENFQKNEEKSDETIDKHSYANTSKTANSSQNTFVDNNLESDKEISEKNSLNSTKSTVLKYLFLLLIVLIIGFIAFMLPTKKTKEAIKNLNTAIIEEAYSDSVLSFATQEKIRKELDEKYQNEGTKKTSSIISAHTFELSDIKNETGYYTVIGSYKDMKNANNLISKNKTQFKVVVFSEEKIRVALKLSDSQTDILEDFETIRNIYPNAWLLHNSH